MKVFVDANILLSAAYSAENICAALLLGGPAKGLRLFTCDYAAEEALRNLRSKAPHGLVRFPGLLEKCKLIPTATAGEVPRGLPAKDHPIWLSALAAKCDVLLTGDKKDFGKLKHPKIKATGPGELFDAVFR